jgi:hypothetical protein
MATKRLTKLRRARGMQDRRSDELIRRNHELLAEVSRIRLEMTERAERLRLSNQRIQALRIVSRPRSDLFHESWDRR